MSNPPRPSPHPPAPLYKQNSWSPDSHRDEAWLRQKAGRRRRRGRSVTDEDLEELRACIELGFGFDSPEMDQRLSDTFPAYGLYYAVNKKYNDAASNPPVESECVAVSASPIENPSNIFGPGENPEMVKARLRQWAQVVACSVRQSSS